MGDKLWVVVEYVMWEYCCIVGIFETEQEAIDMQARGLKERQAVGLSVSDDFFLGRYNVPFGEINAKSLVRHN